MFSYLRNKKPKQKQEVVCVVFLLSSVGTTMSATPMEDEQINLRATTAAERINLNRARTTTSTIGQERPPRPAYAPLCNNLHIRMDFAKERDNRVHNPGKIVTHLSGTVLTDAPALLGAMLGACDMGALLCL